MALRINPSPATLELINDDELFFICKDTKRREHRYADELQWAIIVNEYTPEDDERLSDLLVNDIARTIYGRLIADVESADARIAELEADCKRLIELLRECLPEIKGRASDWEPHKKYRGPAEDICSRNMRLAIRVDQEIPEWERPEIRTIKARIDKEIGND